MKVAKIVITRRISDDGDLIDSVVAIDRDGDDIPLTDALGMMRLAEDSLIRERMDEA